MKSLNAFQLCMKVLRVLVIVVTVLMAALTIFFGISLAVWMTFDEISFVYRSDFYQFILHYTDIGTYYYNISYFTSKLAFSLINTTLLVFLINLLNHEIRTGNPSNEECVSLTKWMGIRCFVFPSIALAFSTFIFFYFNQTLPYYFIDFSYIVYGIIFILASLLLKHGCKDNEEE